MKQKRLMRVFARVGWSTLTSHTKRWRMAMEGKCCEKFILKRLVTAGDEDNDKKPISNRNETLGRIEVMIEPLNKLLFYSSGTSLSNPFHSLL